MEAIRASCKKAFSVILIAILNLKIVLVNNGIDRFWTLPKTRIVIFGKLAKQFLFERTRILLLPPKQEYI